jgi:hypothetical protein
MDGCGIKDTIIRRIFGGISNVIEEFVIEVD